MAQGKGIKHVGYIDSAGGGQVVGETDAGGVEVTARPVAVTDLFRTIYTTLGIDAVVSPNAVTISTILRHVRRGAVSALHTLREGFGEVIEAEALPGSRLVSGPLQDVVMPDGMRIGAVVRDAAVVVPDGGFRVQPGDRIVAIVTYRALRKAEAMLTGAKG